MKTAVLGLTICIFSSAVYTAPLCAPGEEVLYSCETSKSRKTVSLCMNNKNARYLFGTSNKIELSLPDSVDKIPPYLSKTLKATGETKKIIFSKGSYKYILQNVFEGKPPADFDELVVYSGSKKLATLEIDNGCKMDVQKAYDKLESFGMKVVED